MRLTLSEAEELVEVHLMGLGEQDNAQTYSATVFDSDTSEVWAQIDQFLEGRVAAFDRSSITVAPDHIDDMDIPCVAVTIKLEVRQ